MKLIDITCPKCNSVMQVNSELKEVTCNYCGNKMLIDDEIKTQRLVGGFEFGYEQEMGRLKAQRDYAEQQALEEERRARRREEHELKGNKGVYSSNVNKVPEEKSVQNVQKNPIKVVGIINLVLAVMIIIAVISSDGGNDNNFGQFMVGTYQCTFSGFMLYFTSQKRGIKVFRVLSIIMAILSIGLMVSIPAFTIFVILNIMEFVFLKKIRA